MYLTLWHVWLLNVAFLRGALIPFLGRCGLFPPLIMVCSRRSLARMLLVTVLLSMTHGIDLSSSPVAHAQGAPAQCSDGIDNDGDGGVDALIEGSTAAQSVNAFSLFPNGFPGTPPVGHGSGINYRAEQTTAHKLCEMIGYGSASFTGQPWDSPHDNAVVYWDQVLRQWRQANATTFNSWMTSLICSNPAPACSDGIDNDGDGKIDHPQDPGCATPDDNSEVPHDLHCTAPSDPSETPTNGAQCVGIDAPNGVNAGQQFTATIRMRNTGESTWERTTHHVASESPRQNTRWGRNLVNFAPDRVAPGQTGEFTGVFTAPQTTGVQDFDWTMAQNFTEFFGDVCRKDITVQSAAAPSPRTNTADLAVAKTAPATAVAGQQLQYVLRTRNNGPQRMESVIVRDAIATGLTFVSANGASCSLQGGVHIVCQNFGLNAGEEKQITLTFTAGAQCPATVTNTARIYARGAFSDDFDRSNGSALGLGWTEHVPDFAINGNRITHANPGAAAVATVEGFAARDVSVSALVSSPAGANVFPGLVARYQGPGDTGMYLGSLVNQNGSLSGQIWKNTGGNWVQLASAPVTRNLGVLQFDVIGSDLRLFLDGTFIVSASDTSISGEGSVGIRGSGGTYDDFIANAANSPADLSPANNQASASTALSCAQTSPPQCSDGIDNDGDGAIDLADFSCQGNPNKDDETTPKAQCQDGIDNDGDGKTDFPNDPGCSSKQDNDEFNQNPQCSDGLDNDGDGTKDFPNDAGCVSPEDTNEGDNPACSDGIDNDGDGKRDFPLDPGCSHERDTTENDHFVCAAGQTPRLRHVLLDPAFPAKAVSAAGGVFDTATAGFALQPGERAFLTGGTATGGGDIRQYTDDRLTLSTPRGTVQRIYDTQNCSYVTFDYDPVEVTNLFTANGVPQTVTATFRDQCGNQVSHGAYYLVGFSCAQASPPQCSDGVDNDGDGAIDLADFSCQGNPNKNDETTPKAQCQDGIDNDGDGKIDHPQDPGCSSKQDNDEFNAVTADLSITKTGPATAARGGAANYSILVRNAGPGTATNITVQDPIPAGFTFNAAGSDVSCARNGANVLCNNFSLAAGQQKLLTVSFTASTTIACGTVVQNRASVATAVTDPTPGNNQSNTVSTIVTCAQCSDGVDNDGDGAIDLADFSCQGNPNKNDETNPKAQCQDGIDNDGDGKIDHPQDPGCSSRQDNDEFNGTPELEIIKAGPATVAPGQQISYTLTGRNTGGAPASNVVLVDFFPADLTFVSASHPACTLRTGLQPHIHCPIGTLHASQTASVVLRYTVKSDAVCNATFENQADIQGEGGLTGGWSKVKSTVFCPQAGIRVTKTGPSAVNAGEAVSYVLSVQNTSASVANQVEVRDIIPAGFTLSAGGSPECALQGADVLCTLLTLAPGGSKAFTVRFQTPANQLCGQTVTNTARARAANAPESAASSVQTRINCPSAVLTMSTTDGRTTAAPGDALTYTVSVTNTSAIPATNVTVTDTLPAGVTFSAASAGGTFAGNTVTWNSVTIPAGVTVHRTVNVTVNANVGNNTVLTNVARTGTLTAQDQTTVVRAAQCSDGIDNDGDGKIDFPADPGCSSTQDNDEFNALPQCSDGIDNDGDGAIDLTDFSCQGNPNKNDETNPKAQCQDGIDNDGDGKVDFLNDPGCSSRQDNDEFNQATADLDILKSGAAQVQRGGVLLYTLTARSFGPDDVTDVVIRDPVPFGLLFQPAHSDPFCHLEGAEVVCRFGTLDVGGSRTAGIAFTVPESLACNTTIQNRASVSAAATDPYPGNNQSRTVTTTVQCPTPQCSDRVDNDGDGATDLADFSCQGNPNKNDETNPKAQCQDGIDNDGDGKIDFPADPGCSSTQDNDEFNALPQCSDGIDNDGDGATDLADFSCQGNPNKNDETNPKAQCSDGIDNDGDGRVDFPADPGCSSTQDNDEFSRPIADMDILMSGVTQVERGGVLLYTVTGDNFGPETASDIVIHQPVPYGLTFHPGSSDSVCRLEGDTVVCAMGTLASGQTRSAGVAFRVPETHSCGVVIESRSTITSSALDPYDGNNESFPVRTTVTCPQPRPPQVQAAPAPAAALTTSIHADHMVAFPGDTIGYWITTRNATAHQAPNVEISFMLPVGMTAVETTGAERMGSLLRWRVPQIAPNGMHAVRVTVRVDGMVIPDVAVRTTAIARVANAPAVSSVSVIPYLPLGSGGKDQRHARLLPTAALRKR
jgi:uncharacterized repeat protein (TIGR01451 family)